MGAIMATAITAKATATVAGLHQATLKAEMVLRSTQDGVPGSLNPGNKIHIFLWLLQQVN